MTEKTSDRLKNKAKALFLRTAILLSASSGINGVAAAQNTQHNNNSKNHSTEVVNQKNAELETKVPLFFGEKKIEISRDQVWDMTQLSEMNEPQIESLIKVYATLKNSPQGLTDKNWQWAVQNSVKNNNFTKRQGEILINKAFEYNAPQKMPESIVEDVTNDPRYDYPIKIDTLKNDVRDYSKSSSSSSGKHSDYAEIPLEKNTVKPGLESPGFVGEKGINLSTDQVWEMVKAANLNREQMNIFADKLTVMINSLQGLTDKNFEWIVKNFVKDNTFSKTQGDIVVNMARQFNEEALAKDEPKITKKHQDTKDNGQNSNFSYSFEDGKLNVKYEGFVPGVQNLQPNPMQKSDGTYRCGPHTGPNLSQVIRREKSDLTRIAVEDMVFQDLNQRIEKGETLGDTEKKFMESHQEELKKHGLFHSKNKLQQKDRQITPQQRSR